MDKKVKLFCSKLIFVDLTLNHYNSTSRLYFHPDFRLTDTKTRGISTTGSTSTQSYISRSGPAAGSNARSYSASASLASGYSRDRRKGSPSNAYSSVVSHASTSQSGRAASGPSTGRVVMRRSLSGTPLAGSFSQHSLAEHKILDRPKSAKCSLVKTPTLASTPKNYGSRHFDNLRSSKGLSNSASLLYSTSRPDSALSNHSRSSSVKSSKSLRRHKSSGAIHSRSTSLGLKAEDNQSPSEHSSKSKTGRII